MNYNKWIFKILLYILIFNLFTHCVYAIEQEPLNLEMSEESEELEQGINNSSLLLRYFFSVLGVILLTYLAVKFLANRFKTQSLNGDWIRILDQLSLGANKGIFLVEIEDKGYVLGVTDQQINVITTIEDQLRLEELRSLTLEPTKKTTLGRKIWKLNNKQGDFQKTLQYNLQKIQNLYSEKEEDEKYEK